MKTSNFFLLAAIAIALISFVSRFWRLDAIPELVFDEVYYVKFANNYRQGLPLFDAHPPLGKYLIALSIQLFGDNPFGHRAFNALAGSLIPLITGGLVLAISNRYAWALWAGFYTAMDGLLLVESRYSLINIYLVLFGILSQLCLAIALRPQNLDRSSLERYLLVLASGLFLGASIAVKWSGLTYLVGLVAIAYHYKFPKLPFWQILGVLLTAISFYLIVWIPHLVLNPGTSSNWWLNLWAIHQNIFAFHQNLGVGKTAPVHPYCSSWWSWVFLIRPIAYHYKVQSNGIIAYVNALGNPFLYWLGAIAILTQCGRFIFRAISTLRIQISRSWLFVLVSFLGHLLPWSLSHRCTFLYHYMPASIYAFMAIALLTEWFLSDNRRVFQALGQLIPLLITIGFVFWLPVYTGLPITQGQYRLLMWSPSWI